ncbi:glycosyltransferase family 2 protein [Aureitalea marina]|uniref:Glycosyltransferase 2-like domain-containing protein n=1 Tax=Aureitalea marina TaxID=930804 RepID=A0A2S7KMM0_9FLAO|nr:glycosyltransferase family 2 protein [Aureitalea marina]PQB03879.1 hypothetical protein BST85_02380 [Aureitalea marina]
MASISVITVNYNNAEGLRRTFDSVAEHKTSDLEYIVVDGNSDDDSLVLIEGATSLIDQWISEKDEGIYQAMNKGIAMAQGEYVLFLNSGDHFTQGLDLTKVFDALDGTGLIACDIHVRGTGIDYLKEHPETLTFSYLMEDTLAHQSVLIRRELFQEIGSYDESLKITADWKFFMHAIGLHRASYKRLPLVLSYYYLDGISATGPGSNMRKAERRRVIREEFAYFYQDYRKLKLMGSNRFKMLTELENSKFARKFNSFMLRLGLFIFRGKRLKDLE